MIFERLHRYLWSQRRRTRLSRCHFSFQFIYQTLSFAAPVEFKMKHNLHWRDGLPTTINMQPILLNDDRIHEKERWKETDCNSFCCRIISIYLPVSFSWHLWNECCMPYLRGWRKPPQCETLRFFSFFFPSPHLPKLLVARSTDVTLSGCWFVFSAGLDTQTQATLRQQTPLASNMQMRRIIVVVAAVAECICEGRTIQSSVLHRLLKLKLFLPYFLKVLENRLKSQRQNGSFYFHFRINFVLLLSNSG